MKKHEKRWKLAARYFGLNLAGLFFAYAGLLLEGALAAVVAFTLTVLVLPTLLFWRRSKNV